MTEIKANYKHGGTRTGAGRPKSGGRTTVMIRVKKELVPLVKAINDKYKLTGVIPEIK